MDRRQHSLRAGFWHVAEPCDRAFHKRHGRAARPAIAQMLPTPNVSAVNAVAGIVVSLNQGNVGALNAEAEKLFTTLTPVIPMN